MRYKPTWQEAAAQVARGLGSQPLAAAAAAAAEEEVVVVVLLQQLLLWGRRRHGCRVRLGLTLVKRHPVLLGVLRCWVWICWAAQVALLPLPLLQQQREEEEEEEGGAHTHNKNPPPPQQQL
jgi:hypothetical protein